MQSEREGAGVSLSAQDIALIMEQCGFKDRHEIGFYLRSLDQERLINAKCSADNTILEAAITINGYWHLNSLKN